MGCGVEANAQSRSKEIPLHIAIRNSLEAVTHLLLDMGADVNAKEGRGKMPLHLTIVDESQLAPLLLKSCAD